MRPVLLSGKGGWAIGAIVLLLLSVLIYVGIYGGRVVTVNQEVWQPASSFAQDTRKEPAVNSSLHRKEPAVNSSLHRKEPTVNSSLHRKKPSVNPSPHRKDVVDNTGAIKILQKYKELFYTTKNIPIETPDPNKSETVKNWWQAAACLHWYMTTPLRYKCQNTTAMGNWFICQDQNYLVKPYCLVYSFGIAFDFAFDNAMVKLGCEVHSFDPSMKKKSYKRGKNSYFHNLGLGAYNTDGFNPRRDGYVKDAQIWKMRTLKSVMKMLGHENYIIDVLKIDIETNEWPVVDNLLESGILSNVRQLLIEFHLFSEYPRKEEYVYLYNTYTKLREMGFREFQVLSYSLRMIADKYNHQAEVKFVNVFFQRPEDGNTL